MKIPSRKCYNIPNNGTKLLAICKIFHYVALHVWISSQDLVWLDCLKLFRWGLTHFILKPSQDLINKFMKKWLLSCFKHFSVKYFPAFPLFMKLYSKTSDTTIGVFGKKWVKSMIGWTNSRKIDSVWKGLICQHSYPMV